MTVTSHLAHPPARTETASVFRCESIPDPDRTIFLLWDVGRPSHRLVARIQHEDRATAEALRDSLTDTLKRRGWGWRD